MIRRKTAREVLAESFRELAQTRTVDTITVRDIIDNCGYSAATFYRQFHDKYDMIAWEYAQRVSAIMSKVGRDGYSWRQTLLDGALLFDQEREDLTNLLCHTSGHDAFIRYMAEINFDALKGLILKTSGREALDRRLDMCVRVYVLGTVSLTCEWILGKYPVLPQALADVFEKTLPLPLHEYLIPK